jgi:hypothetical protein
MAAADMAEKESKVRLNDASATLKAAQAHEVAQDTAMNLHGIEREMLRPPQPADPEEEAINAALAEAMQPA